MSGPIFGTSSALNSGSRNLVEFRAGRMNLVGKMVHPDTRKGLLYLYQSEDNLTHFCWKDRTTGNVEEDLIIFPDDCEFKRVEACKTGRVYLLRFKSSNRKLFFWMQEPKTDKDDDWCRRINEVMNNPPSANSSSGRGTDNGDLQYMLNNMSQQQLMQLFGGVGQMGGLSSLLGSMNRSSGSSRNSSSTTAATAASSSPATRSSSSAVSVSTPVSSGQQTATPKAPKKTGNGAAASESSTPSSGGGAVDKRLVSNFFDSIASGSRRTIDLSNAINAEILPKVLANSDCVDALVAHLPEIESDADKKQQLKETLASPQFQQALSTFSSALQSGQLGPVVSQFQLNSEAVAAAVSGDLEQFVKALEKTLGGAGAGAPPKAASSEDSGSKKEGEKKAAADDDDEMSLG